MARAGKRIVVAALKLSRLAIVHLFGCALADGRGSSFPSAEE
jgi:hypothetical protein